MTPHGPGSLLLAHGQLPISAQMVAARNPDMLPALTRVPKMPVEVWHAAFQPGLSAAVTENLASLASDPKCVEKFVDAKEKRIGPMKALLVRWVPTVAQQLVLASRALPPGLVDFLLEQPWFVDEAASKLVTRASPQVRFNWATEAPTGVSDDVLVKHVKESLASAGSEIVLSEGAKRVSKLAHLRPGTVPGLLDTSNRSILSGLSMVPLSTPAVSGATRVAGKQASSQKRSASQLQLADFELTLSSDDNAETSSGSTGCVTDEPKDTSDGVVCQFSQLWDSTSNWHSRLDVACNLLLRPDCPSTLKDEVWSSLSTDEKAEALSRSVASPASQLATNTPVSAVKDPCELESLLWGEANERTSGRPWLWFELADNPHLSLRLANLLYARCQTRTVAWNHRDILMLVQSKLAARFDFPSKQTSSVDKAEAQEHWVNELKEAGQPVPAAPPSSHRRRHSYFSPPPPKGPVKDVPDVFVLGDPAQNTYSRHAFEGRLDDVSSWLSDRLGSSEPKWELFYSFVDDFEGTVKDLVEMVESVSQV